MQRRYQPAGKPDYNDNADRVSDCLRRDVQKIVHFGVSSDDNSSPEDGPFNYSPDLVNP
jgi:hypothetical protein